MSQNIKYAKLQACLFVVTFFLGIDPFVAYGILLGVGSPWISCFHLGSINDWFILFAVASLISGVVSGIVFWAMCGAEDGGDLGCFPAAYLCGGILCAIACLIFVLIMFVGYTRGSGSPHPAPGRAYPEYRFNDFTPALRRMVSNPLKWGGILTCLSPSDGCLGLNQHYPSSQQLFNATLPPLQSGCCMPPAACGFTFVSPTSWTSPTNNTQTNNYTKADCAIWSNDESKLCYSCNSCKAGSLAKLRKNIQTTIIVFCLMAVASFIVHVFSACLLCATT